MNKTQIVKEIIGKKLNPNKPTTWFEYSSEEEYKNVLDYLGEIIIKYGFDFLKQMSVEEEIIPTKVMAEKLYRSHKELKQQIIFASEKPYGDVKELFVQMAAFIGERNCDILGAKWFFIEQMQTPFTQKENNEGMCFFPLSEVVGYYREYKKNRKDLRWFENEIAELKRFLGK